MEGGIGHRNTLRGLLHACLTMMAAMAVMACHEEVEHTAPAINPRDSVPMMVSYGVNTLISDSGVIKYRIVAEKWEVNTARQPSRWTFDKGVFLEQFDQTLHVESYIQCDTAYYYDVERLWELHGRVTIYTKSGVRFLSEELFWDEKEHQLYSNKFSHLITAERELQGNRFRSDEKMTKYQVYYTKGSFQKGDIEDDDKGGKKAEDDSTAMMWGRRPATPTRVYKTDKQP